MTTRLGSSGSGQSGRPLTLRLRACLTQEDGLTLVELLVVMVILAILLGALVDVFSSAIHSQNDQTNRVSAQQDARLALDRLRREIHCGSAIPSSSTTSVTVTIPPACFATSLTSSVSTGATTVPVVGTGGFPPGTNTITIGSSGTVTCTGMDATNFTGCSGVTGGPYAVGTSVVAIASKSVTWCTTGTGPYSLVRYPNNSCSGTGHDSPEHPRIRRDLSIGCHRLRIDDDPLGRDTPADADPPRGYRTLRCRRQRRDDRIDFGTHQLQRPRRCGKELDRLHGRHRVVLRRHQDLAGWATARESHGLAPASVREAALPTVHRRRHDRASKQQELSMNGALAAISIFPALAAGSFLNVVAARVPLQRSIVSPGSACMSCGQSLSWRDNIPLVSFLLLRGRCRYCGAQIPWRYPAVEATTAVLVAACVLVWGISWDTAVAAFFCATLVAISAIDIERRIIPNRIVLPAAAVVLVAQTILHPSVEWIAAALGASLFFLLAALAYPAGMGMGDVKLALLLGAALGRTVPVAMMTGMIAAIVPAAVLFARHGSAARKMSIPFGPFLAFGGVIALFAGTALLDLYLGLL